jgi:8-oxo-dGTP pyrophosphatase MutT (NUDIX family)
MKIVTLNPNKLTMDDIDREQHRVKVLLFNSKNEILLCKINGVYNFIGGHIEGKETALETAQREIKEEAGISLRLGCFSAPFFKLQAFEKNYYGSPRNYFTTIEFIEGRTDTPIDLNETNLDPEEQKKDFRLEYVPYKDLGKTLEENREAARAEEREFIIDEMLAVLKVYKSEVVKEDIKEEGR